MIDGAELFIPDAARNDPKGFELLRVWIADDGQQVALRSGFWKDPAAWGIMLADLAKHIANSYEQGEARDRLATLKRIKAALDAEFAAATDEPSGWLHR